MTVLVILPWPAPELNPNARTYRPVRAALEKEARWAAKVTTLALGPIRLPKDAPLALSATFDPPDQIGRDLDNRLAQIKSGIDGVCDALKINDKRFKQITLAWGEVYPQGRVELRIEVLTCLP